MPETEIDRGVLREIKNSKLNKDAYFKAEATFNRMEELQRQKEQLDNEIGTCKKVILDILARAMLGSSDCE